MDIDVLREVQQSLSRYIYAKGFISWDGIKKACERIILSLPDKPKESFKNKEYPEFEIFIPLLRNGSAEVCKSKERATLLFCMNPKVNLTLLDAKEIVRNQEYFSIHKAKYEKINNEYQADVPFEEVFDSLAFLKSYPSIQMQIETFSEQQIQLSALHFVQNPWNYHYEVRESKNISVGIYKLDDRAWTSPYLFDMNKKTRKISYYAEDPDAMNLARLYVRINNPTFTKPIFEYNKESKELKCYRYSEMPILLSRALILFEPKQLFSKEFCTNYPSEPFKEVPEDAVIEMKRIFSDKVILIKQE